MPRPAVPDQNSPAHRALGVLMMALYFRPWLDQPPPYYHPKHKGRRIGRVLAVAMAVALAAFLAALITAIVTAGGSWA
jgi:hypothetical protein